MSDEQLDFTVVVEPTGFAEADSAFAEWLSEQGIERSALADDDIRIDTMRGAEGEVLRRYRVRRSAIRGSATRAGDR
jgi:hypothetical protein